MNLIETEYSRETTINRIIHDRLPGHLSQPRRIGLAGQ